MIVQHDGMWWPAADTDARPVITADCASDIKALLPHIGGRDLILQAGANVGVYPLALADHFRRVVTVEPDPENFACLWRNLDARDSLHRVEAMWAAFGAEQGSCKIVEVKATNVGAHRVDFAAGTVPVVTIDHMALPACDAIWLDVEGAELLALQGAEETVERFAPTIAVEDKGLHRSFAVTDGALQDWMAAHGYHQVDRFGRDKIFRRG